MKEVVGDLWDYIDKPHHLCCITTNGFVKVNGEAVMGRGCAKQAADRWPHLPIKLGRFIQEHGNILVAMPVGIAKRGTTLIIFPVKHKWFEDADLKLIRKSALALEKMARQNSETKFILPRPGCGNGKLDWSAVKEVLNILPDNVLVIDYKRKGRNE